MDKVRLPDQNGNINEVQLSTPREFDLKLSKDIPRKVYSAVHVVSDPLSDHNPWLKAAIDWEETLNFRRHLWRLGLGVAEAMDTAQRGMGLGWLEAKELIRHSLDAAKDFPDAEIVCGCGTDQLSNDMNLTIDLVIRAYEEQMEFIEKQGGKMVIMASRALTKCAKSPDDFTKVYSRILDQAKEPVIIHWLGEMFDHQLKGYWGQIDIHAAMDECLSILSCNAKKIDGIKISLLDKHKEISMRRRLPKGLKMYTGDDFNYPELIAGDEQGYSDALLGIFDPIATVARAALVALGEEDLQKYNEILLPTLPLSRHIFKAPTQFYKTGVVFLAYLNGHQKHFTMIGGQQSARSLHHLVELFRLANKCGILNDPPLAAKRLSDVMKLYGFDSK